MRERKTNRRKLTITRPLDWKEPIHSSYVWGLRRQFVRAALALEPELGNAARELVLCWDAASEKVRDEACRRLLKTWAKYNLKDDWCRRVKKKKYWVPTTLRVVRSLGAGEAIVRPAGLQLVEPPPLPNLTRDPNRDLTK